MNGKRFSGENAQRSGFYLALAVCLVAVGIAAWSTYDAVNGVVEPAGTDLRRGEQHHRAGKHQLPAGEPAGL